MARRSKRRDEALPGAIEYPLPPGWRERPRDPKGWKVRFANGGWLGVERHDGSERMRVRFEPDDNGRLRIRELHLLDIGEPVTAQRLRAVLLGAIEGMANSPNERQEIQTRYDKPPAGAFDSDEFFHRRESRPVTAEELRSMQREPSLVAPRGRGYPDDFYANVAEEYRAAVRRLDPRPVKAIAESAGVPRSTAGRWVKEARRRRLLGGALSPGKIGDLPVDDSEEGRNAS